MIHGISDNYVVLSLRGQESLCNAAEKTLEFLHSKKALRYQARAVHLRAELNPFWVKGYFGEESYLGNARNIARMEVLVKREDCEYALKLFNQAQNLSAFFLNEVYFAAKGKVEGFDLRGICSGIKLDIARRYLKEKIPVQKIVDSLEKGASKEAAAIQIFLGNIGVVPDLDLNVVRGVIGLLKNVPFVEQKDEFRVDYTSVEKLWYKLSQEHTAKILSAFESGEDLSPHVGEDVPERERRLIAGFFEFQCAHHIYLRETSKGSYSQRVFSAIKNPSLRQVFQARHDMFGLMKMENIVLKMLGLKEISITDKVGAYFQYATDQEFINQFEKLGEGFYGVTFFFDEGSHTISYIKEAPGVEYILDPNGYQLRSNGSGKTRLLFQKLFHLYFQRELRPQRHRVTISQIA